MRNRRKSLYFGILLLMMGMGLGYAFLTTTLNLEGTTEIDANTWNVYWDNIIVTPESVSAEEPVIDSQKTTVSFSVHLSQPGDFYEFTVNAVNDGSIDAMIDTAVVTVNGNTTIPNYLSYTVTYSDNYPIAKNQILMAGKQETYKIFLKYRDDIEAEDLPNTVETLHLVFDMNYIQADNRAIERPLSGTYYYTNTNAFIIGQSIESNGNVFDNQDSAISNMGENVFLQYKLENNIITEAFAGFVSGGDTYYLKGGDGGASYEANKEVLNTAFPPSICYIREEEEVEYYRCNGEIDTYTRAGEPTTSTIEVYENGKVIVGVNAKYCTITNTATTYCVSK